MRGEESSGKRSTRRRSERKGKTTHLRLQSFSEVRGVGHYRGSHTSFTSLPPPPSGSKPQRSWMPAGRNFRANVRRELKIYPLWNWLGSALTRKSDSGWSLIEKKIWNRDESARARAGIARGYFISPVEDRRSPTEIPLAKKIRRESSWVHLEGVVLMHLMDSMGPV